MSSLMNKLNHTSQCKEEIKNAINNLVLRANQEPYIDLNTPLDQYASMLDVSGWNYMDNINLCNYRIHIKYAFPTSSTLLQFDTSNWLGNNNFDAYIIGPDYSTIEDNAPSGEYIHQLSPDGWSGSMDTFYPKFYYMTHNAPNGGGSGGTMEMAKNQSNQSISFTRDSWDHFYIKVNTNFGAKFWVSDRTNLDYAYLLVILCNA